MPEECLFIGDHPINDIQGAQNAGMHPVWMEGFHEVDPYDAQLISPRIKNLRKSGNLLVNKAKSGLDGRHI